MSQREGKSPSGIKRVKGRVLDELQRSKPRDCQGDPITPHERPLQVAFTNAHERAVVSLALMLLGELRAAGGSCISAKTLEQVRQRAMSTMTPEERMELEIETYEILQWLGTALAPQLIEEDHPPERVNPQSPRRDIIRWAITYGHDLIAEYYDSERGELIEHKLTPMSLKAGTYLRAISHLDRDERIFEVSHFSELRPAAGWPVIRHESPAPSAPYPGGSRGAKVKPKRQPPTEKQMSLLGEEE